LVVENRSKDVDCLLPGKCVQKNPVGYSCLVLFSLSRCRVRDVCCWGPSVAGLVCGGRCRGWCRGRCRGHVVGDGVSSLSVGVTVRLSGSEEAVLLGVMLVGATGNNNIIYRCWRVFGRWSTGKDGAVLLVSWVTVNNSITYNS